MDVTRLSTSLGAEVRGLALADPSQAGVGELKALLTEHLVLFLSG